MLNHITSVEKDAQVEILTKMAENFAEMCLIIGGFPLINTVIDTVFPERNNCEEHND